LKIITLTKGDREIARQGPDGDRYYIADWHEQFDLTLPVGSPSGNAIVINKGAP
jgi:hypothetical protein